MRAITKDRIAHVVEMRRLRLVKENAIFEFARVSHDHAIAHNDVLANVTTAADLAVFADPGWPFHDRALLDDRSTTDEDRVTDERFPHELAQYARLQTGRMFETKKFSRRKHLLRTKRRRVA